MRLSAENLSWSLNQTVVCDQVGPLVTPSAVIRAVKEASGVSAGAMLSRWRSRKVTRPRQIAMLLVREACPDLSLPSVARIFDRDHSTVIHGIRAARKATRTDPEMLRIYERARNTLGLEQ